MTRRNSWLMCARSTVTGSWWAIREVCMRWASACFPTCVWSTTTAGPTAPSSSTTASEFIFTSSVRSVRAAGESSRGGEESETRWRRKWEFELKELGRVGRAGITRPALMWFRVSVKCGTVYAVQRSEMFGVFMHFCHNVGEIGVNTHDVQIRGSQRIKRAQRTCVILIPPAHLGLRTWCAELSGCNLFNVRTTTRLLDLCFSQSAVDTMYHSQKRWVRSDLPLFIRSSSVSFLPSHPSAQIINYPNTAEHFITSSPATPAQLTQTHFKNVLIEIW